jgi:protein-tyrosine phosphatase
LQANAHGLNISSAGIKALVDKPIDASAAKELDANGYSSDNHVSRQLNDQMVQEADLILVMEVFQQQRLMKEYPAASGKVMLLGKWLNNLEINDPYRKSAEAFALVFDQIQSACQLWVDKLMGR